jgi:hypothetical protein
MPELGQGNIEKIAGVKPRMDDTDKQAVSLYAKSTVAGDTPMVVNAQGNAIIGFNGVITATDALSNVAISHIVKDGTVRFSHVVFPCFYNGDTWDRVRANAGDTVLASGIRSATTTSADKTNYNERGAIIFFDVTAVPGIDTVALSVEVKDPLSGKYVTILDGGAKDAVGTYIYAVYPGAADGEAKFDAFEAMPLPRTWRVTITHSAATDFTYSVGACYVN